MNTADGRQAPRLTLAIVGGASGVGKSTLLGALDSTQQSSTGTLFKNRMTLATLDEVRSSHWPDYEEAVTEDLRSEVIETLARAESAVIDTHFAAKTPGGEYRIGLRADLLVQLGDGCIGVVGAAWLFAIREGHSCAMRSSGAASSEASGQESKPGTQSGRLFQRTS